MPPIDIDKETDVGLQDIFISDSFLNADETTLRAAVQKANIPALMMSLLHLEGDDTIMSSGITPQNVPLSSNEDGLTSADRQIIRDRAVQAALEWRQSRRALSVPDNVTLDRATSFIIGQETV